jgi:hypothetical protein
VTLVTLPLIIDVSRARETSIWGGSVTSVTGLVLQPFPHPPLSWRGWGLDRVKET